MLELPQKLPETQVTVLRRDDFDKLLGPHHLAAFQPVYGKYLWLLLSDWRLIVGDIGDHSTLLKLCRATRDLHTFRHDMLEFHGDARQKFIIQELPNVLCGGACDETGKVIRYSTSKFEKEDAPETWKPDLEMRLKDNIWQFFHEEEATSVKTALPTPSGEKP